MDEVNIKFNLHQLAVLSHTVGYLKSHLQQLEAHIMQQCQAHDDAQRAAQSPPEVPPVPPTPDPQA
jgi:hypothetical protein